MVALNVIQFLPLESDVRDGLISDPDSQSVTALIEESAGANSEVTFTRRQ